MTSEELAALVDQPLLRGFGVLLEVSARLERIVGDAVEAEHHISHVMLEVLFRLAEAPGSALPIGKLGRDLVVTSGGATRLVARMEALGLVRRRASEQDGRVQLVELTGDGATKLRQVIPTHLANLQRSLADALSPPELQSLIASLERLGDHARRLLPHLG